MRLLLVVTERYLASEFVLAYDEREWLMKV